MAIGLDPCLLKTTPVTNESVYQRIELYALIETFIFLVLHGFPCKQETFWDSKL